MSESNRGEGGVLPLNSPQGQRLFDEMTEARAEWARADRDFQDAMQLFRDLQGHAASDGNKALEMARIAHRAALEKYTAAVRRYFKHVLGQA